LRHIRFHQISVAKTLDRIVHTNLFPSKNALAPLSQIALTIINEILLKKDHRGKKIKDLVSICHQFDKNLDEYNFNQGFLL